MISEYIEHSRAQEREIEARAAARERRRDDVRQHAMTEVLTGNGPFWNTSIPEWDNEQWIRIFCAVHMAVAAAPTLTDTEFKELVMDAVKREAAKYAEFCAEDTD